MTRARTKPTADVIDLNAMGRDVATSELPATMPILLESNAQIVQWQRELANAKDERALVDEQIESAQRVRNATADEADRVMDATVHYAREARDRAVADADKLTLATVTGYRGRQVDIDQKIAGFEAAIAAAAPPSW
jgi:chromosome segregation ATPase